MALTQSCHLCYISCARVGGSECPHPHSTDGSTKTPQRTELMAQDPEDQATIASFLSSGTLSSQILPPGCAVAAALGQAPSSWEDGRFEARWGMRPEGREPVQLRNQAQG